MPTHEVYPADRNIFHLMFLNTQTGPEAIVAEAAGALARNAALDTLEAVPTPLYATDVEGRITWFNQACVAFAGRQPKLGEDRWCVTWRLYTEGGEALPHEKCPMAVAVRERRPVRGVEAVAERPDGTRRRFAPFPTPVFDADGRFAGAVNLLLDITDRKRADHLTAQASRCRRLAASIGDLQTVDTLKRLAAEYQAEAEALARPN